MRRLRILGINNYSSVRGGSDRYFLDWKRLLESRGHRVVTVTTGSTQNARNPMPDTWLLPPIDLQRPRPADVLRFFHRTEAARLVTHLIRRVRPHLAHLHIYYGQITPAILAPLKEAGIPIVQTVHEYKLICPVSTLWRHGTVCHECRGGHWHRAVRHRCNRGSLMRSAVSALENLASQWKGGIACIDRFIAVSHHVRRELLAAGIDSSRIATVHNFTDVPKCPPTPTHGRHVLYFGRLERQKGLVTLLDASAHLPGIPLLLAGAGEAQSSLEDFIRRRRLHHVHLLGFQDVDALERVIRESICTVLPSEWPEPFGLTLIESFVRSRPVVASRIGGIPEIVDDGVDGWLVEPGNVRQLRERLEWMARNPDRAVQMGRAGHRKARAQFSADVHYPALLEIYRSLGADLRATGVMSNE